jgi:hypothetical protein
MIVMTTVLTPPLTLVSPLLLQDQFQLIVVLMKVARARRQKEDQMGIGEATPTYAERKQDYSRQIPRAGVITVMSIGRSTAKW